MGCFVWPRGSACWWRSQWGLAGPPLLRLIFGGDVILSSGDCILIAIASAVALANLVATVMLLAQERTLVLTVVWAIALIPGVLIYVSRSGSGSDPLTSVCWAFLVVETAAMLGLQWAEWRGVLLRRRAADPGDWSKEVPAT